MSSLALVGGTAEANPLVGASASALDTPPPVVPVAQRNGTVAAFWTTREDHLRAAFEVAGRWQAPQTLSNTNVSGNPTAVETTDGHLVVLWNDRTTGHLMQITYNGTSQSAVSDLGISLGGQPYAVGQRSGVVDVFAANSTFLEHTYFAAGQWHPVEGLAGDIGSDPSPILTSGNHLEVFWKDAAKGQLQHIFYDGTRWVTPENLGMGPLGGEPRAVGKPDGTIDVFWRGLENGLWHAYYSGGAWHGADRMTSASLLSDSDPSPVLTRPDTPEVYWETPSAQLSHDYFTPASNQWNGPEAGPTGLGNPPQVASAQDGTIHVFWIDSAAVRIITQTYNGTSWSSPQVIGASS